MRLSLCHCRLVAFCAGGRVGVCERASEQEKPVSSISDIFTRSLYKFTKIKIIIPSSSFPWPDSSVNTVFLAYGFRRTYPTNQSIYLSICIDTKTVYNKMTVSRLAKIVFLHQFERIVSLNYKRKHIGQI